jgi:transposase
MELLYPRCAGLDVHKKTVVVCRVFTAESGRKQQEVRTFGTTTRELLALLDWLRAGGCTHVAMESTGEYWKPVYNLLEGHAELLLVNPQHCKNVPGRKTDVKDAEWLAELLRHGLVKGSFVPVRPQRELRDLTRGRVNLVEERARVVNRLQKVLEDANIKLGDVASDVTGASGRAMLSALCQGENDPEVLANLARGVLRDKHAALVEALEGRTNPHHRFLLTQHLEHLAFVESQIAGFDQEIERQIERMSGLGSGTPAAERDGTTESSGDTDRSIELAPASGKRGLPPGEPPTYARAVELALPIPGIGRRAAQALFAEMGVDMRRFPSAGHLASWAGVAPGNRESAGKRLSGKTTHGNAALRKVLVQVAHAASRTKDCSFNALYHRIAARRGKKRAIVAVARALLVALYHVLLYQEPYRELGEGYLDEQRREQTAKHLTRRLRKLGYAVSVTAPTAVAA